MGRCATCGNEYPRTFEVRMAHGERGTFDSFECAIHRMAPACARCGIRVVGHGVETPEGAIYCCASCARMAGARGLVDHDRGVGARRTPDTDPSDRELDAALEGSFPASDPPPYWAREP
jgi:hypothetical protein